MEISNLKKVLVVGTGSIGFRHIANLKELGCRVGVFSCSDRDLKGLDDVILEHGSIKEIIRRYDAVVIANATNKHLDVARVCIDEDTPFYIEKPLSHNFFGVVEVQDLIIKKGILTKVGYMLRAHPNLVFIHKYLKDTNKRIFFASATVGQWLGDWRPNRDYRDCYSSFPEQGGGVIFELIHEIDIACWLFGEFEEVFCFKNKVSELEINTEDFAQIILKSKKGFTVDIKMDYLKAIYKRDLEIVMNGASLVWDYVHGTVRIIDKANPEGLIVHQVPPNFTRNSMFLEHMANFLADVDRGSNVQSNINFSEGSYSMLLAVKAHESSKKKKWISI